VQVRISENSDMGVTAMYSRHQKLEHTGGRSLKTFSFSNSLGENQNAS
jgi:hypothetical protein